MNAYELADEIDNFLKEEEQLPWGTKQVYLDMASTMIRQQAKRIEELEYKNSLLVNRLEVIVNSKPLSDEEILDIWYDFNDGSHNWTEYIKFARTIEERHGIK